VEVFVALDGLLTEIAEAAEERLSWQLCEDLNS
jgi:hypothetical protein